MSEYLLLAAAATGESSGMIGDVAKEFGVSWSPFISQLVSFSIMAFLLHRFAYKPILTVLEQRRQVIAKGLADADQIKRDLANAQTKVQELINQASTQANKIIEEARAAAAKVTEQETQKAVAAAQDIINKARQSSEAELARMKTELRREVGRLVVATTAKVAGKVLSPEDQARLAEEANRQLAA